MAEQTGGEPAEVRFERRGRLGVVTLDRPKAVNALTAGMASAMLEQLTVWADDDGVAAVLVRGGRRTGALRRRRHRGHLPGHAGRRRRDRRLLGRRVPAEPADLGIPQALHCADGRAGPGRWGRYLRARLGPDRHRTHQDGDAGNHDRLCARRRRDAPAVAFARRNRHPRGAHRSAPERCRRPVPGARGHLRSLRTARGPGGGAGDRARGRRRRPVRREAPPSVLAAQQEWIDACYSSDDAEEILRRLRTVGGEAADAADTIAAKSPTAVKVALASLRRVRGLCLAEPWNRKYRVGLRFLDGPISARASAPRWWTRTATRSGSRPAWRRSAATTSSVLRAAGRA